MAERPTHLPTERAMAATLGADIVHRLNYWQAELIRVGLIAEGVAMHDAANEITMQRLELGGRADFRPVHRGVAGELYRA